MYRPTPQCWWCQYLTQTREYLLKGCREWNAQQKILWAEVRKETGRWEERWKIRDILVDERCSRAVPDFLSSTDVGRLVPSPEESDAASEAPEWDLQERQGRGEEREAEEEELGAAGELDAGKELPLFLPTPPFHGIRRRGLVEGTDCAFLCFFPLSATLFRSLRFPL